MYRVISVPRRAAGRGLVRARTRLSSTNSSSSTTHATPTGPSASASTPPPPKSSNSLREFLIVTITATGTFYLGGTFVSYMDQDYRKFFTQSIPGGKLLVEYGEEHQWDEITVQQVVVSSVDTAKSVYDFVQRQLGNVSPAAPSTTENKGAVQAPEPVREGGAVTKKSTSTLAETKEHIKSTASELKTAVQKSVEEPMSAETAKGTALAKYKAAQFAEEVDELVRKAEAALAKPADVTPLPEQASDAGAQAVELVVVVEDKPEEGNVYVAPLPIGFEPPPGFSRPAPPKVVKSGESALVELPLVAPTVVEVAISEPVVSHLAGTIDDLASYLKANPVAAEKAKGILETARTDLTELASRFDKIREEEKKELEARLDEQAHAYNTKLLELEIDAQDTLLMQREDYERFVDEEKSKVIHAYREKLDEELKAQTELINDRLQEAVIAQGIELQRRWIREIQVKVEEERGGRLARLDELATGLKRLERLALDNSSYLDENIRVHGMWTAIRAMQAAMESPVRKPFREELRILRHVAIAKEDEVVSAALENLEGSDTPDVGVEPLADLTTWFTTSVAPRVSSVALVPDQNAGVLTFLASHLLSSFRFQRHGLTAGSDVLSVLARAEHYMNEKDLDSAARELNQLTGPAKELLHDWLEAARRRLEAQQALEVIQAQATVASLLVL